MCMSSYAAKAAMERSMSKRGQSGRGGIGGGAGDRVWLAGWADRIQSAAGKWKPVLRVAGPVEEVLVGEVGAVLGGGEFG